MTTALTAGTGPQTGTATVASTRSRRALLAGALAGIGAWAATAIGRALPARAANGENVTVGGSFTGTTPTIITTTGNNSIVGMSNTFAGLWGESDSGPGAYGTSDTYVGVLGTCGAHPGISPGVAVQGVSSAGVGVLGFSMSNHGVRGQSNSQNGVWGTSASSGASGVYGDNTSRGYGVAGRSNAHGLGVNGVFAAAALGENTADGIGVWARSQDGVGIYADAINLSTAIALKTRGVTQFDRSGKLTILAGRASATKTGIRIDSGSLVLATLQQDRSGIYVRSAVPNATGDSFTIRLNKAVGSDTKVGWFIVN